MRTLLATVDLGLESPVTTFWTVATYQGAPHILFDRSPEGITLIRIEEEKISETPAIPGLVQSLKYDGVIDGKTAIIVQELE